MDIKKLLGKRIKEYRLKHGFTQAKLSELLGIDDKHLSCLELGKNMPNPNILDKLANIFEIEVKDLFEYYHMQNRPELKGEICNILEKLSDEQLVLAYKYIRTFVL